MTNRVEDAHLSKVREYLSQKYQKSGPYSVGFSGNSSNSAEISLAHDNGDNSQHQIMLSINGILRNTSNIHVHYDIERRERYTFKEQQTTSSDFVKTDSGVYSEPFSSLERKDPER